MEDTHSGVTGVGVAEDVEEEFGRAPVHAPIPRLETEEDTALGRLVSQGPVTPKGVQVKF